MKAIDIKANSRNTAIGFYPIVILFLFLSLSACEEGVVFKEANPPGIATIDKIPEIFHGTYMCESDSSIIRIRDYDAMRLSSYSIETSIEEVLESEHCAIVDGGLHIYGREECFPFDYISEDSISADIYLIDTMFAFDEDQKLKYYEGQLFLNTKTLSGNWLTWTLAASEGRSLAFSFVSVPADEEAIGALSQRYETGVIERDRVQYILDPTIEEFDFILSQKYSELCDILIPIDIEHTYPGATTEIF